MRTSLALSVMCCLALTARLAGAPPEQPAPSSATGAEPAVVFGAAVELVTVDAVVVDKQGQSVLDLKREDFLLAEEGVPQVISSFEAVNVPRVAPPAAAETQRPARLASNVGAAARVPRLFAIVFDDMHMTAIQAQRAKLAVAEFLRSGVGEGDRIVIAATSGGAWWNARMSAGRDELIAVLKRFEGRRIVDYASQDRITDYEALRIENFHDTNLAARVARRFDTAGLTQQMTQDAERSTASLVNPYVEMRARQAYDEARVRNRVTLGTLKRLLDSLTLARGRKSLILVSEGFIHDTFLDEMRDVVRVSRRANTPIYFVDTRGLEGAFSPESAEFGAPIALQDLGPMFADLSREADGSRVLADETGGFTVHNTNDLAAGIARIARESQGYYLLGYNPRESYQDGRFRKLDLRVNRRGVTVRARRGYYAPTLARPGAEVPKPEGVDPALQQALDAPFDLDAVPLRMTAYVFGETLLDRAKVVVAADADIRNLAFVESEGRLVDNLDVLLVVAHRETGEYFQYPETIAMRLRPQTLAKAGWYPLVRDLDLAPGTYLAKLVVRDTNAAKVGSLSYTFEVPALGALRASTPIVTDKIVPSEEDPSVPRTVVVAHRNFLATGRVYCQLEVFNASRDPESGRPRVTFGFSLIGADGTVARDDPPSLIAPSSKGAVTRLLGFAVDDVAPGEHTLVINLKDEISGQTLELREPLTLERVPETSATPALAAPSEPSAQ